MQADISSRATEGSVSSYGPGIGPARGANGSSIIPAFR